MSSDKLSRITDWWRPKAGGILSLLLFYLALWHVPFADGWKLLTYSVVTLTGFGIIGYILNDWADIPYDLKAGKTNLVGGMSVPMRVLLLLGLLAITMFPWVAYFKVDGLSIALILIQFTLQIIYPFPPIRVKNYPVPAIVNDALYAFVVPCLLAWHTFDLTASQNGNDGQVLHFVFLSLWMLAMGVRHILNHHVADKENDRLAGTPNLALRVSTSTLRKFIERVAFPVELLSAILFFTVLLQYSGLLPVIFIAVVATVGAKSIARSGFPFVVGFAEIPLDRFTSFGLGALSLLVLMVDDTSYALILLVFLLMFSVRFLRVSKGIVLWRWPWQQVSLAGNWSIYYFRKWVLRWSEERNWGSHYPKRLEELAATERSRNGTIAVFNQNRNKYSETFVSGQVNALNYEVLYLSGWPTPGYLGGYGELIDPSSSNVKLKYGLMDVLNESATDHEDRIIAQLLLESNVSVIVAHFGPMGVRLLKVARITGIPLMVVFHGYDAWNREQLETYADSYKELFKECALAVGVSRQICTKLVELGCPADKVEYMPAHVDPAYFGELRPMHDTGRDFLSVGRFSCTKAPFLVIEAFRSVLAQLPDARLTMIGGDDGEGLYEACVELVKAHGMEHAVRFAGILSPTEVLHEMQKAAVFVQHSVTTPLSNDREGTPVSVMEAMALGLPIVATDHAGIGEMVENGVSGILVAEYDCKEMAAQMVRLANDAQLRSSLGQAAAAAIRNNPLVSNGTQRFTELIERCRNSI